MAPNTKDGVAQDPMIRRRKVLPSLSGRRWTSESGCGFRGLGCNHISKSGLATG